MAYLLKKEGNEVKLFIENKKSRKNFENMVSQVDNWRTELSWVGREGLIIFDDVGYGKIQDRLRDQGYTVFGGSEMGERIELDREYGQRVFSEVGMQTTPLKDFDNIDDAIKYIKKNPTAWVVKNNNHDGKFYNYIGECSDGKDVIAILKNYLRSQTSHKGNITLHQRLYGIEIGVGRYFNGSEFVGPIEFNVEHTRFFPGDLGPITSEMGTLAWYDENENNKLYQETLGRLKEFLIESKFRGDFEVNCIVNEKGVFPLEATTRFGSPIIHLHDEIHISPWSKFLYAVASGRNFNLKWKKGYGIVILMAVPPFPYADGHKENSQYGVDVHFQDFKRKDFKHIHFEEISLRPYSEDEYFISDSLGYILYVTGMGNNIEEAQKNVYDLAKRIIIPKVFYRNDIGQEFIQTGLPKLKKLGYF